MRDTSRKPAWNLQPGDVIDTDGTMDTVLRVRRMLWDGELDGKKYQNAPVVQIEIAAFPGVMLMTPGDELYTVSRRVKT